MHDNLADDGSIYVFHSDSKGLIFRRAFDAVGFYLSGLLYLEEKRAGPWAEPLSVAARTLPLWLEERRSAPVVF